LQVNIGVKSLILTNRYWR